MESGRFFWSLDPLEAPETRGWGVRTRDWVTVMLSAPLAPGLTQVPRGCCHWAHTSCSQAQDTPFPVLPKGPRETGLVWGEGWGAGEGTGRQGRRPRTGSPLLSDMKHPDPGRPTLGGPGRHLGPDERPVCPSPGMGRPCSRAVASRSGWMLVRGARGVQLPGCTAEGRWRRRLRTERGSDTESVSSGSPVQPRPGGHLDVLWPCPSLQPSPQPDQSTCGVGPVPPGVM